MSIDSGKYSTDASGGPLTGVRILDLTTVVMGPYATMILSNLGADIIKLEPPAGDIMRYVGPMKNPQMGHSFLNANHGKRSIVLDLKRGEARAAALELARSSDVFVHNIRPDALNRLGLGYEAVADINPKIIYAAAIGFGTGGRYSGKPAYDDLIQGIVGIPSLVMESGGDIPRYLPTPIADRSVGLYLVGMISSALYAREVSGKGQSIEVPMFEVLSQYVLGDHMAGLSYEPAQGGPHYTRLISKDRRPYKTSDGYICALIYNDSHWKAFFNILGEPNKFHEDERFSSQTARSANIDEVYAFVSPILETKATSDWLEIFAQHDIPAMPLNTIPSLLEDPHLEDVGFFEFGEHPTEGRLRRMKPPEKWSETPSEIQGFAPNLGEHSREILSEIGMSAEAIDLALETNNK